MQTKEQNMAKNLKALGITIAVHALLLLAFWLLPGFAAPPPLPNQDLGMEVNLGTSDQGMGEEQPLNPNPPSNAPAQEPAVQNTAPTAAQNTTPPQDIATQDEEDAPAVTKPTKPVPPPKEFPKELDPKPEKVKHPKPVEAPPTPAPPERHAKAVATGGTFANKNSGNGAEGSNNSKGEGNTGQPGDRGAIGGNPNGGGYTGGGLGGGKSDFRLTGRNLVGRPTVTYNGSESGYVAVNIKVDRDGNVIEATHSLRGSTLNNPQQISIALDAARRIKYNASPDAPEVQFGNIRFYFKVE
ncbi:outer membrane transport energization protein TonB [Chitinophaga costaii]|uniref:Outer membrane transport energization protein TonB n=1 Tax=Chitinophaga costaii TaxID=1335309 RepID=A0A1C4CF43_9BACT|nr:hypothetical protein [Chitinophaga costaii]PUZ27112.1 hypothetical protein DCM91_07765 [Chitinophaga costaii]SCC17730.1 outer membrane transport energization protein TonB [Chitinophaga costaii]